MIMNSKHIKTLKDIFVDPASSTIECRKIEALFVANGATIIEGNGSRVRFELNEVVATFH